METMEERWTWDIIPFSNHEADAWMADSEDEQDEHEEGVTFLESTKKRIPEEWILLDNQSTSNVISNPALLKNIRSVSNSLTIQPKLGKTRHL